MSRRCFKLLLWFTEEVWRSSGWFKWSRYTWRLCDTSESHDETSHRWLWFLLLEHVLHLKVRSWGSFHSLSLSVSVFEADVLLQDGRGGLGSGRKIVLTADAKWIMSMLSAEQEEEAGDEAGKWRRCRPVASVGFSIPNEINPADNSHGSIYASGKSDEGIMCPVYMLHRL